MEALMLHFPLHVLPPGLLAHEAASSAAVNHLKRRKVVGVVVEGDEASRSQQFEDINTSLLPHHRGGALLPFSARQVTAGRLTGGHVLTGGLD